MREELVALRAQVRQAALILSSAVDHAIITMDGDGLITGWNAGAGRILGYGEAEVLGRSGEIVFTDEDRTAGRFATEMRVAREAGGADNERWHVRRDGTRFWASGTVVPLLDEAGGVEGFLNILRDRTGIQVETERRELLLAEMGHRIRNTFATVQAVAMLSRRHAPDPVAFQAAFDARIQLLSRANDVLTRADQGKVRLRELVEGAVEAYGGEPGRIVVEGPAVLVAASIAVSASLILHELTTNAVKHGALSCLQGRVEVSWTAGPAGTGAGLASLVWRERGGPPVQQPRRRGFGSRLLERGLPPGSVRLDFDPEGLECRVCLPLADGSGPEVQAPS